MAVDDMSMTSVISKLAEVDPVFCEVVDQLYPGVDPRELWDLSKSMPDQSAVHHNSGDKKKKALAAGLLFGTAAEGAATYRAAQHALGHGKEKKPHVPTVPKGQGELFHPKLGTAGKLRALRHAHAGKGEFALQAANMAIGLGAARELFKPSKPKKISKAEFLEICEPILAARREHVISTEKALEMIDEVEKGFSVVTTGLKSADIALNPGRSIKRGSRYLASRRMKPAEKEAYANQFRESVNQSVATGRKIAYGLGGATAVGAGVHFGRKREREKLIKSEDNQSDYEFTGDISKLDDDKHQVFGWCSLSTVDGKPVVDLQNDYISIEEIEKSAYSYVKRSRKGGDMHARVNDEPMHTSDMIESVIVTPEKLRHMGLPEESIAKAHTGWWVGFQVNDEDQWHKVKANERTGFSIHGTGSRLTKVLDD